MMNENGHTILQWQYTSSARKGGFHIYSCSQDLLDNPDDLAELERRATWKRPECFPDEIQHLENMPVMWSFFRLSSSGRYVISRTFDAGCDFRGREGNFFSHALILDNDKMWTHYPTDYCCDESVFFVTKYPDESSYQERLPPIVLKEMDKEVEQRKKSDFSGCFQLIADVVQALLQRKRIILAADNLFHPDQPSQIEKILQFISEIHRAFPIEIAHSISFTTYAYTQRCQTILFQDSYQVLATVGECTDLRLCEDDVGFDIAFPQKTSRSDICVASDYEDYMKICLQQESSEEKNSFFTLLNQMGFGGLHRILNGIAELWHKGKDYLDNGTCWKEQNLYGLCEQIYGRIPRSEVMLNWILENYPQEAVRGEITRSK